MSSQRLNSRLRNSRQDFHHCSKLKIPWLLSFRITHLSLVLCCPLSSTSSVNRIPVLYLHSSLAFKNQIRPSCTSFSIIFPNREQKTSTPILINTSHNSVKYINHSLECPLPPLCADKHLAKLVLWVFSRTQLQRHYLRMPRERYSVNCCILRLQYIAWMSEVDRACTIFLFEKEIIFSHKCARVAFHAVHPGKCLDSVGKRGLNKGCYRRCTQFVKR